MTRDVLVLGSGPAGVAAAASCCAVGLEVQLLAPNPRAEWVPTYSAWDDELPGWAPRDERWPTVSVHLGDREVVTVNRAYAKVDRAGLHALLWAGAEGVRVTEGRCAAVRREGDAAVVTDHEGREHRAAVVIDAMGSRTATQFQTAYGLVAEVSGPGVQALDPTSPRWMDFSMSFGGDREAPTFLYALPHSDGTWLLEETALIREPLVPYSELERRLWLRLGRMGIEVGKVHGVERCTIPMNVAVPAADAGGRVIPFGTAAGMVHPATGFLVARVLSTAPRLAAALGTGLSHSADRAIEHGRSSVWPTDTARRHGLFRFGSAAMAGLSAKHTRAFFRAFFSMPDSFVRGFLGGTLPTSEMVAGMTTMFQRLPLSVQWRLVHPGSAAELARAVMTRSRAVVPDSLAEVTP